MPDPQIDLLLIDGGSRGLEPAAGQVALGKVRLGAWQVHPVRPTPRDFAGLDIYLIKVNYELSLEPDVPGPNWLEVGFRFHADGGHDVAILDAIPQSVIEPQDGNAYVLDPTMSLVPAADGSGTPVHMPPAHPIVQAFGLGTPEPRWRHRAGAGTRVGAGSYVGWLVLAIDSGVESVTVAATARYDLPPEDTFGDLPATRPTSFRLGLISGNDAVSLQSATAATVPAPRRAAPRVFVSYAHDTPAHTESVRRFAEFLVEQGVDADLDQWNLEIRHDWYLWAIRRIKAADFILVVASPQCRAVGDGEVGETDNKGMQSELGLLRTLLHSGRLRWTTRILPVVLPGGAVDDIPLFLSPWTGDHYRIAELDVAGAEDLLRALTDQPAYVRPTLRDAVVRLPPRSSGPTQL